MKGDSFNLCAEMRCVSIWLTSVSRPHDETCSRPFRKALKNVMSYTGRRLSDGVRHDGGRTLLSSTADRRYGGATGIRPASAMLVRSNLRSFVLRLGITTLSFMRPPRFWKAWFKTAPSSMAINESRSPWSMSSYVLTATR